MRYFFMIELMSCKIENLRKLFTPDYPPWAANKGGLIYTIIYTLLFAQENPVRSCRTSLIHVTIKSDWIKIELLYPLFFARVINGGKYCVLKQNKPSEVLLFVTHKWALGSSLSFYIFEWQRTLTSTKGSWSLYSPPFLPIK